MTTIYLDHAASAALDPRASQEMFPWLTTRFGNPSSPHPLGEDAREALRSARYRVAGILFCQPDEIIFTSGGTESINLAIIGAARANKKKGRHLITSGIEHKAVLASMKVLEQEGFEVTFLAPAADGTIRAQQVKDAMRDDTLLVSLMLVNNEIGSVNPIAEIGEVVRGAGALMHSDACQAPLYHALTVDELKVDLLTLNGSKIGGPKGSGLLYVRAGVEISPLLVGGGQERGLRSGTENVSAIVGFAAALDHSNSHHQANAEQVARLRDRLQHGLEEIDGARVNNAFPSRAPHILSVAFPGLEADTVLLHLGEQGLCAGSGSACTSRRIEPSHVLTGIGIGAQRAKASIRYSLGPSTTIDEIDQAITITKNVIATLRPAALASRQR